MGLVLRRSLGTTTIVALFNIGAEAVEWPNGLPVTGKILAAVNGATPGYLPPFGALLIGESE